VKISTRSRYGLRLLYELAKRKDVKPVFLNEIAKQQDVSEKYLSKLVIPLRSAGIIRSSRGAHGGYVLARKPAEISLLEVIEVLEGSISLIECMDDPAACERSDCCSARPVWKGLEQVMRDYCSGVSLESMIEKGEASGFSYVI
jgi:Rrf2 family protein